MYLALLPVRVEYNTTTITANTQKYHFFECGMHTVGSYLVLSILHVIGSDCSRVGVDKETTIVCLQRRRTDGATVVRRLDDGGGNDTGCCYLNPKLPIHIIPEY